MAKGREEAEALLARGNASGSRAASSKGDIESGSSDVLSPEMSASESAQRWLLIRKVYSLLSLQLILTATVATVVVLSPSVQTALKASSIGFFLMLLSPIILLFPLLAKRREHPTNLALLGLFTLAEALSVGVICSASPARAIAHAFFLTASSSMAITSYTFYAIRRGHDFDYLGPALSTSVWVLIGFAFIQALFPVPNLLHGLTSIAGAGIFSAFLVYDTSMLVKRYSIDEYILATVEVRPSHLLCFYASDYSCVILLVAALSGHHQHLRSST
jgi:FtsH-binding integral membrane protein